MIKKLLLFVLLFSFYTVLAQEPNRTYVPDDAFEQALIDLGYDDVLDDYVLTSNINTITDLDLTNSNLNSILGIADLTGIEEFMSLKKLDLYSNRSLSSLDVTNNKELEELDISETGISDVNVAQNLKLQTFYAFETPLERIDVSQNLALKILYIQWSQIREIDVSNNLNLEELTVRGDAISTIDVSDNILLRLLSIEDTFITEINLSTNIDLEYLELSGNELKSLDLTKNTSLRFLNARRNALTCIQVADLSAANQWETYIDDDDTFSTNCGNTSNELTFVPDDKFEQALIDLGYDDVLDDYVLTSNINTIKELTVRIVGPDVQDFTGIEDFTALEYFDCSSNSNTELDVSKLTQLKTLNCYNTNLSEIDLSNNLKLEFLNLTGNTNLSEIDLSNNLKLETIYLWSTTLPEIDLSKNIKLKSLSLGFTIFSEIDLSKNIELTDLIIANRNLKVLDLTNNTLLKNLEMGFDNYGNHLGFIEELYLPENAFMDRLNIYSSKLKTLDLSKTNIDVLSLSGGNPDLTCIKVADVDIALAQSRWYKNDEAEYSLDCSATDTCTANGTILMERYDNINGSAISDLLNATNYPHTPSLSSELTSFEIQRNQGDKYGVRVSGYLCPPETGTYYFYIAGNNHTELNLSTTDDSADKVRIAHHKSWASNRQWDKFATQKSQGISLEKGKRYYIEALMKEASAGDNLAVGWRKPSEGDGTVASEVIPGSVLSPRASDFIPVTGISISPSLTISENEIASISPSVSPSNASYPSVNYIVSDASVASVDTNGLVKGVSQGTVTITAKTNDGGFTAQAVVTVIAGNPSTCNASGTILMERYDEIGGLTISNLLNAKNYPDNPSNSSELSIFEIPKNQGDNYGVRVHGYLCPPETGTYYFYIAGNNHTELNLSTTEDSSDKVRIAHHESYASNRQWDKFATQKSQGILLQQGNRYYIEALMKEDAFGDNLAVAWRKPSDGNGEMPTEVLPGSVLSPFANSSKSLTAIVSELPSQDKNEPDLTISPNPASTEVNVVVSNFADVAEIEYTIYTLSGIEVLSLKGYTGQMIDVSWLAKGTYQLVARSGSWSKAKNLIVR
ncbi:PA14 domain-containing protein [Maribacter sp. 2308TA10-17]|uniref:PA14 domain-containing protein n=1 Tax=Maribacter sp. 2308TA10-17 TaxID=3386276 RepID=UPI0039BD510C